MFHSTSRRAWQGVLVLELLLLASCGGSSGGGGGGGGSGVGTSMLASVAFPPNGAVVLESQVTLRGSTVMGGDLVRVNGLAASSDDGFMTWSVNVSVMEGMNDFAITIETGAQVQAAGSYQLRYETMLDQQLGAAAMGVDGSLVHFARSETSDYILARLNVNGTRSYFNGISNGSQVPSGEMAYDSARNRVALVTGTQVTIFDLLSESIVGVYSPLVGTEIFTSVEFNPNTGQLFVASDEFTLQHKRYIYSMNPLNGDLLLVTGPMELAPGSLNPRLRHLSYDTLNGALYVWDSFNSSIVRVDVSVGSRTVIATGLSGYGNVTGLEYRTIAARIDFVTDLGLHVGVDRFTGIPSIQPRSSCDPLVEVSGSAVQAPNPPYLGLVRNSQDSVILLRQDRAIRIRFNGDCDELLSLWRGKPARDLAFGLPFMTWDSQRKRIVAAAESRLYAIDPKTGDIQELPGPASGFLNDFVRPIRYDSASDRIYYISARELSLTHPGGIYSIPAVGGEETLEVPLAVASAAMDVDYDPIANQFLTLLLDSESPVAFTVRRSDGNGVTLAEQQVSSLAGLANYFQLHASSSSVFTYRNSPADLVRLQLPNLSIQSLGNFVPDAEPLSSCYDASRDEFAILDNTTLRVTDVAASQMREVESMDGNYRLMFPFQSVTRDPESGLIYLGGQLGRILVIDPDTLDRALVHY